MAGSAVPGDGSWRFNTPGLHGMLARRHKAKLAQLWLMLFVLGCAHPLQAFGRIMAPPLLTKLDDPKEPGLQVRK